MARDAFNALIAGKRTTTIISEKEIRKLVP
jgi:hypothetical protein